MSKEFTANDVKEAGSVDKGLHIIIDNDVYKMDGFVEEHPGGAKILKRVGGKDASKQFWKVSGHSYMMCEWLDMCCTEGGMIHCCMGRPWTWTLGSLNGFPPERL
jgi:cytochrome b involved in lipid metabolism